ncbi:[Fe-Fe] hydrogenase large subunit C-terminal domain-containing protein [Halanaerobacter jeridensis]|uniref:Methyl-accepting chemotaxis protein/iron only hydrogenase large subunit-like protein n=1 Tax=Halanaerobacter jeridensis TaxID=706427 RepID=A0A939BMH2_9FIRM|nr:[Fe-Fe] hydrogenase large subunit C-terminal domain-containing protein [Halanaerobacter jeridensis]MBM7556475.1 methyl-accepting chemotaxis protein/iron only hydrogenase large subunit-like protein [Halanaerobacter jeridensis]
MLSKLVKVNPEKCINCQRCIAVCPVKFCNDGSSDYVEINDDMCIGCGACIEACNHDARTGIDDWKQVKKMLLEENEDLVAVVDPAVVADFPNNYLRINGCLDDLGVAAVFDAAFGAELMIKSYSEYIKNESPTCIISQQCPTIINYLEIYQPQLLDYLAPVDSPTIHTIKMIKHFYPQYQAHEVVVVSPCLSKKRELEETGVGDYNVTFKSIKEHFKNSSQTLFQYSEEDYTTPDPERGVLVSKPGGLLEVAQRDLEEVENSRRQIAAVKEVYDYLAELEESIEHGFNPLLIDCLSCGLGCNGGPGAVSSDKSRDELEFAVNQRSQKMKEKYKNNEGSLTSFFNNNSLAKEVKQKWKSGLYTREYKDLSAKNNINYPNEENLESIFQSLGKKSEKSRYINCSSCGYFNCHDFAVAVYNGLNKKINCRVYAQELIDQQLNELTETLNNLSSYGQQIEKINKQFSNLFEIIENIKAGDKETVIAVEEIAKAIHEIAEGVENLAQRAEDISTNGKKTFALVKETDKKIQSGTELVDQAAVAMEELEGSVSKVEEITDKIMALAQQTNLLSLDGAIELANSNQGFGAIADDIKDLADESMVLAKEAKEIMVEVKGVANESIKSMMPQDESNENIYDIFQEIKSSSAEMRDRMKQVHNATESQVAATEQISASVEEISASSTEFSSQAEELYNHIKKLKKVIEDMTKNNQQLYNDFKIESFAAEGLLQEIE